MTIFQAILCGIVYWLGEAQLPFVSLWVIQRPLVCGLLTGIILGDPVTGAVVGATINLVYLGFISAGGSMPLMRIMMVSESTWWPFPTRWQ